MSKDEQETIFILISYKNGANSDWIEISPAYFKTIKAIFLNGTDKKGIAILDRKDTYPLLVKISEVQSIEVDVPN